ncbi:CapA family protein [Halorussus ruber]|uniref:CapA family protein n=1 Tax=Halorussus ruber TaxID=1126238 RepID=UPI001FEACC83|nr:CapA family protein [Halorussus ruber]
MPRLGFTGDVMLGRKVDERQRHRNRATDAVWGSLAERLRALDGLFINLECNLSTRGERWTRTERPFHFRADPDWAVPALESVGVEWAGLANNHMLDYGETALRDTIDHLDAAGIAHSGAGENVEAAREPAVVDVEPNDGNDSDALRIAFVSATDNTPEFAAGPTDPRDSPSRSLGLTAADETSPGTAYLDLADEDEAREEMTTLLTRARDADPDLLVVSLHWGPNMVEEPPDHFRSFGRWLAERGVDLVHGHSAHVFQGVEIHDGTPLLYDCGDFVDDYAVDADLRNDRGFLFEAGVEDEKIRSLRLVPTEIEDCAVYEASSETAAWSRSRMRELSAAFGTEFDEEDGALVAAVE